MTERENILGRIREALTVAAPIPGQAHADAPPVMGGSSHPSALRHWLPPVGDTFKERLDLFRTNAAMLKADFRIVANREELATQLLGLRDAEAWKRVGTHAGELTDFACSRLGLPTCRTDSGYDVAELESCDAAITECDALVAQTGSVLVTSRSAGGRALSVLPPHHIVLAQSQQLLGDLPEAFAFLKHAYAPGYPSFISFITGPSRTGDIERILVLGAHGPRKLTIFMI